MQVWNDTAGAWNNSKWPRSNRKLSSSILATWPVSSVLSEKRTKICCQLRKVRHVVCYTRNVEKNTRDGPINYGKLLQIWFPSWMEYHGTSNLRSAFVLPMFCLEWIPTWKQTPAMTLSGYLALRNKSCWLSGLSGLTAPSAPRKHPEICQNLRSKV